MLIKKVYIHSLILVFFFLIGVSFFIPNKAHAQVTCQKLLDVVIVIDNSASMGDYHCNPDDPKCNLTQAERDTADAEWPNMMKFVKSLIDGFDVEPGQVNLGIVTFEGVSMYDRILARVRIENNTYRNKYGGSGKYPVAKLPLADVGNTVHSDTISVLTTDKNLLTNNNKTGAFDLLSENRIDRTSANGYSCYREPKEYIINPPEFAPPSAGYKCGSTDIAAGLNRAKTLLDSSPRKDDPNVERKIILLTDGLPDDDSKVKDRIFKDLERAGATSADIAAYPYFNLEVEPIDPLYIAANKIKNDPKDPADIFAVTVGKDDICVTESANTADCQQLLKNSDLWMTTVASSPSSTYKHDITRFDNFQTVLYSILNYACGFDGLNVNGFIYSGDKIDANRLLSVTNDYSYLENKFLGNLLSRFTLGRHFIDFD